MVRFSASFSSLHRALGASACVLSSLAGCSHTDAGDAVVAPPAATDPDAGPEERDIPRPLRIVHGTAIDTAITETGDVAKPVSLRKRDLGAVVRDGLGGWQLIKAIVEADGSSFRIESVPVGPYWLKDSDTYTWTSAGEIDLGGASVGRAARPAIATSTKLGYDIGAMKPWTAYDKLSLSSAAAGLVAPSHGLLDPALKTGATSVSGSHAWASFGGPWLEGDLYVTHASLAQSDKTSYVLTTTEVLELPAFQMKNATTNLLRGAFKPVPQDRVIHGRTWRRSLFAELAAAASPVANLHNLDLNISAQPGGHDHGSLGLFYNFLYFSLTEGTETSDRDISELTYGNPFPSSWTPIAHATAVLAMELAAPGAAAAPFEPGMGLDIEASALDGSSIEPLVGPVTAVTIDGQSAFGSLAAVSTMPTVSWKPPTKGTPTSVLVALHELVNDGGQTEIRQTALFQTAESQVSVPPEILEAGHHYFVLVRAFVEPGLDKTTHPYRASLPSGYADVVSSPFTAR